MGCFLLFASIVGVFFATRGAAPHTSELAYVDFSPLGKAGGSVVPASCDSTNWQGSYNFGDGLTLGYWDAATGQYAHSGSHYSGDCTTSCPGDAAHSYDPYYDSGHTACPATASLPTITFYYNPSTVTYGDTTYLVWGSANATSCYLNGSSVNAGTSGSKNVIGTVTTDDRLNCVGAGGSTYATANLTVNAPVMTGTWSYPSSCPAACGTEASTQTQTCTGGNSSCSGSASSRSCSATAACVCTAPLTDTQSIQCSTRDAGWTGTIDQSRAKSSYSAGCTWSDWTDTSNDCSCASPATDTQTLSCQTGYSGSISQSRSKAAYPGCAWGDWTTTANTCVPEPPTTPTFSALWQNGSNVGGTAPAYDASGYGVWATATSPSGAALTYLFQWSSSAPATPETYPANDTWASLGGTNGWVNSGDSAGTTHYIDYSPGTYYARAYAYDANGNYSLLPSDWKTITLTTTAPTVSCSGAPGNPFIGQSVTWTPVVSGGSRSYSYSWSGTDGLSGITASVSKTYATIGQKSAALTVTDTRTGLTGSATCTTGANQPNGPTNGGTCTTGVCPGTCTASLSASPDPVEQGDTVALTWSVTGDGLCASSCSGHGFGTNDLISGSANVVADPKNNNFALTCYCTGAACKYGPPPEAVRPITVWVPTATLTVNGQSATARVNPNTSPNTTIVWSSDHTSSCTGTNFSTGNATSGTVTLTATSQTTYKIDCVNNHNTHATGSVTVNVLTSFNEF